MKSDSPANRNLLNITLRAVLAPIYVVALFAPHIGVLRRLAEYWAQGAPFATPASLSRRRSPFFSTLRMTLILSGRPPIARSAVSDRITRVDADQRRPTRVWHSGS